MARINYQNLLLLPVRALSDPLSSDLLVSKQLPIPESSISCHSGTGRIAEDNTQELEHRMPPKAYAAVVEPLSPSPPPLTAQSIDDAQDILVVSDIMDTLDQIPSELTRVHSDLNELGAVLFCESTSSPSWSACWACWSQPALSLEKETRERERELNSDA